MSEITKSNSDYLNVIRQIDNFFIQRLMIHLEDNYKKDVLDHALEA